MEALIRYVQRAGLVSMLLIVGLLIGWVAPLSADAHPATVKISINGGAELDVVFNSALSCTQADINAGYTQCYIVNTSITQNFGPADRQFRLEAANVPGVGIQVPRLLVSDSAAYPRQMQFTGVQFRPLPQTGSNWATSTTPVTITIHLKNVFNVNPGAVTSGTPTSVTRYGMRLGQVFAQGGTNPSPIDNKLQVWGTGRFRGTTLRNIDYPRALAAAGAVQPGLTTAQRQTVAGNPGNTNAGNPIDSNTGASIATDINSSLYEYVASSEVGGGALTVSNSVDPLSDAPGFACSNLLANTTKVTPTSATAGTTSTLSGARCVPDVDVYYKITTYGLDIPLLNTSATSFWGSCGIAGGPDCECKENGKGKACLTQLLKNASEGSKKDEDPYQLGIPIALPCDATLCSGILRNQIAVTKETPVGTVFPFLGFGPGIDNFEITTVDNKGRIDGEQDPPFTGMRTGLYGTKRRIGPDYKNPNWPKSSAGDLLSVDQYIITDSAGNPVGEPNVTVLTCGGDKGPVIINNQGDYTILYHLHNSQQEPKLCEDVDIQ